MKRLPLIIGFLLLAFVAAREFGVLPNLGTDAPAIGIEADAALRAAYEDRRSGLQIQGDGEVSRVLSDDDDRSRHQRFILRTGTGQTILVAHNIDLAPRVEGLDVGDRVEFRGEYDWNERGGVIHWTHGDPEGRHEGGWIRHEGRTYE
jgi:hypothetical protein